MKILQEREAFTLIELSIVIVIIGLIVAGVVAGQGLVKQAQVRSVIAEQEALRQSLNAFRLQYDALPGDFEEAYDYWGDRCTTTGGVASECNGNGNRRIEIGTLDGDDVEMFRAWQHLNLADLYPGSFTGVGPGSGENVNEGQIKVNIPGSKISRVGITLVYENDGAYTSGDSHTGNIILFAGHVANDVAMATEFSVPDVANLDKKVDDAKPLTGALLSVGSEGAADTDCITDQVYNLDASSKTACSVAFKF